jgi:hypothetical protein
MRILWNLWNFKGSMSMRVSGKEIREMEGVLNSGKMDLSTKGIGGKMLHMALAVLFMQMVMFI